MEEKKKSKTETTAKLGQSFSQPLLSGVFCFVFWFLLFILTNIYVSRPLDLGSRELSALTVFRSRLLHGNFGSYTFDDGMGMSFSRLLLGGFGGIISFPASLLPEKVHPQVLSFLSALRLGTGAGFFFHLIRTVRRRSSGQARKIATSHVLSFVYSAVIFLLCLLLRFPVTDTAFLLPVVLLILLRQVRSDGHDQKGDDPSSQKRSGLPLSYLIALCACLLSSSAWSLLAIPVLGIALLSGLRKIPDDRPRKDLILTSILSLGLCACVLLPQYMQIPYALGRGEPSARFLQELGNDTGLYRTDVTFHCAATGKLLETSPSVLIVSPNHLNSTETDYTSHFAFLNEWFYSLWPALSIQPFQDTSSGALVYTDPGIVTCSVTTLFMDPLYCAVTLPNRSHDVDVFLNDNPLSTISSSHGTVLLSLGEYNVGQTLNLKLTSSHPEDLKDATVRFGHLNSQNWEAFTDSANFGITSQQFDPDGITAEALVATDSTILTNIPAEDGWSIYLNGTKTKVSSYRGAWLCADVPAGSYIVHLHYTAPGSVLGGWISGLSFLAIAVLYMLATKKEPGPSKESRFSEKQDNEKD
ncbi:MAG: YfhO family protein [Clostridiales bacterium]|nr:YfhO family protein [Clostridiales bacterium]